MTVGGILPALPTVATEHRPETTPALIKRQIIRNPYDATLCQSIHALQAFESINFFSYLPITCPTGNREFLSFLFNDLYMTQQILQEMQTGQKQAGRRLRQQITDIKEISHGYDPDH
jgi:hypothetical protein